MAKVSVLMIISKYFGTDGHGIVINNLCINLQKIGYDVAIGAFSFVNEPPENIKKIYLKKFRNINSSGFKADIIHSHQTHMNYYSLFSSVPFLFHYHGTASTMQEKNLKISSYICRNKINKIVAVSNSAKNALIDKVGKIPIDVIYNGVDSNLFSDEKKNNSSNNIKLLFVGNLFRHKNVVELIDAMPLILKKYPFTILEIVGDGEQFNIIKNKIKEKNLTSNIKLLGKIPNLKLNQIYISSDIYISASTKEAFPIPLLESMACGKPLLLSDIAPHKEIISASNAGEVFTNISEIPEKMSKIIENKKEYVQSARKFATTNNWEHVAKEMDIIYQNILSEKKIA